MLLSCMSATITVVTTTSILEYKDRQNAAFVLCLDLWYNHPCNMSSTVSTCSVPNGIALGQSFLGYTMLESMLLLKPLSAKKQPTYKPLPDYLRGIRLNNRGHLEFILQVDRMTNKETEKKKTLGNHDKMLDDKFIVFIAESINGNGILFHLETQLELLHMEEGTNDFVFCNHDLDHLWKFGNTQ